MLKKRNKTYLLVVVIFFISLAILLFSYYINFLFILEKKEINATLFVGDKVGLDGSTTELAFGRLIPGSTGQKNLILENNYSFPIDFVFKIKGNITRFLIFDEIVHLESQENRTISISTIPATKEDYGAYSGVLTTIIKKSF